MEEKTKYKLTNKITKTKITTSPKPFFKYKSNLPPPLKTKKTQKSLLLKVNEFFHIDCLTLRKPLPQLL